jgi:hypothetical protein
MLAEAATQDVEDVTSVLLGTGVAKVGGLCIAAAQHNLPRDFVDERLRVDTAIGTNNFTSGTTVPRGDHGDALTRGLGRRGLTRSGLVQ